MNTLEGLFYSTGQVANRLGVTLATVRLLCEFGLIAAEKTPGGQWRVPASEVERIERDGLPPIPRPLPTENAPPAGNGTASRGGLPELLAEPCAEVESAADQVAITRSTLERRKIEREIEETEDWFRDRQRQRAAAEAAERQRTESKQAEQRRLLWVQQWTEYALNSLPYAARNEVAIELHAAVTAALSVLQADEPETITRPLVDAAVHRVLRPWQRKEDIQRALKSAMSRLPWDVQSKSEWARFKQIARNAAVESVGKLHEQASDREMAAAAGQAVQPMIRAYEHAQAAERMVGRVYVFDATPAEQEAAEQAVREALLALPIGAAPREMEKAKDAALTPYKAAAAQRKEAARLKSEKQARRPAAEWKVERQLDHIERYLKQEYTFDGGYVELRQEATRLRPLVREALIERVLKNPQISDAEIRTGIERQIDGALVDD